MNTTTDKECIEVTEQFIQRVCNHGERYKDTCWAMLIASGATDLVTYEDFLKMWAKARSNLTQKAW